MAIPSSVPVPSSTLRCIVAACATGAASLAMVQGTTALGQSASIAAVALMALAALPQRLNSKAWSPLLGLALVSPWAALAHWEAAPCFRMVLLALASYLWAAMGLRLPKNTAETSSAKKLPMLLGAIMLLLLWLTLSAMGAALSQLIWSAPGELRLANLLVVATVTVFRHAQFYFRAATHASEAPCED